MITANRLAQTITGAKHSIDHMLNATDNESAECVQGSPRDIKDLFNRHKRLGKKFAMMGFIAAPYCDLTREQFMTIVLPLLAQVFGFQAAQAIIFEHVKPRKNGAASARHWHVCTSYTDPITGKINPGWKWSHAKCERVSRELEARFEPENILLGRHTPAVLVQLRSEGLHDIAAKIEAAHPAGAKPENRTPPLAVEQAAKMNDIELRDAMADARGCWNMSKDREEFDANLEKKNLRLAVSNREKPAWVITDPAGTFVNLLTKCLPGVSRASIKLKIGDPKNDDTGKSAAAALEYRASVRSVEVDPDRVDDPAQHLERVDSVPARPVPRDEQALEDAFFEELEKSRYRSAMDRLMSMAGWLTQGAVSAILSYCSGIITRKKQWLSTAGQLKPDEKPKKYDELRDAVFAADNVVIAADIALLEYGNQISQMLDERSPAEPEARKKQIEKKVAEGAGLEAKLRDAKAKYREAQARFEPTFELYKKNIADHQAGPVAKKKAVANRWINAANRVLEAIKISPQLAHLGDIALFSVALAYEEGRKPGQAAPPNAGIDEIYEPESPAPKRG